MTDDTSQEPSAQAQALHILQGVQGDMRDTKRSQWNTTNYAALIFAALVAVPKIISYEKLNFAETAVVSTAAVVVFFGWLVLICLLEGDLVRSRKTARRIQEKFFSKQVAECIGKPSQCSAVVRDLPVLVVMGTVPLGGVIFALWILWR